MKLLHKISKFIDGTGALSARRQLRRLLMRPKFPLEKEPIIQTIDLAKFAKIKQRYEKDPEAKRWAKYLDLDSWIDINLTRIRRTDLDATRSQHVLDLGCGPGYFIYIAKLLGHHARGLDAGDQPMFDELIELLGVDRIIWRIQPFVPLPLPDEKFNLMTGYRVCFNNHKQPDLWGVPEWEFFLDDLEQYLAPRGRIWFELNLEYDGTFYTPELEKFFLSRKANIKGSRILFSP